MRWSVVLLASLLPLLSPAAAAPDDAARRWLIAIQDPARRLDTAYAIDDVTAEGAPALPTLLGALSNSTDPYVRGTAAGALGELGVEPRRLIPPLVGALYDPDPRVSAQAAIALSKIGPPAVPALVDLVENGILATGRWPERLVVRSADSCTGYWFFRPAVAAAMALADIGAPAAAGLVATLQLPPRADLGFDSYVLPLLALRKIGTAAIPFLRRAQHGPDSRSRLLSAIAVARIRFDLKQAGLATSAVDPAAKEAATSLSAALVNLRATAHAVGNHPDLGGLLTTSLGQIGPHGVPALLTALNNPQLEHGAIQALAHLGSEAALAAPALLAVRSKERPNAILVLGKLGSEAALRGLASLLDGNDLDDASSAVEALPESGPAAIPLLSRALTKPNLRQDAARGLSRLGPDAAPAVPALTRMLSGLDARADGDSRTIALETLADIGPGARAAVPELIEILRQPVDPNDTYVHRLALQALGKIGPHASPALPQIVSALANVHLTDDARAAIRGIGPQPEVVHALVIALTKKPVPSVVVTLLAELGPAAVEATPVLRRLRDQGGLQSCEAELALVSIEPSADLLAALLRGACQSPWRAIASAERIGRAGVPFLVQLLRGSDATSAAEALARIGPDASAARAALTTALMSPDTDLRRTAAAALAAISGRLQGTLATIANDDAVLKHAEFFRAEAMGWWSGPIECQGDTASIFKFNIWSVAGTIIRGTFDSPPLLPWPPPGFSAHAVLPHTVGGGAATTLAAVYDRLAAALQARGFDDNGTFAVPGGFALVTRLERIRPDGSPDRESRWSAGKEIPGDLLTYLGQLFLERRGQFRLIAFLVTTAHDVERGSATLNEREARILSLRGGRVLPASIAALPFAGRDCHVLIYHFARQQGGAVVLRPSELSTRQHLEQAGLWQQLGLTQ